MDDLLVDRDAGVRRVAARTVLVSVASAVRSQARDFRPARFLQVHCRGDSRPNKGLEGLKHRGGHGTRFSHPDDTLLAPYGDHRRRRPPL